MNRFLSCHLRCVTRTGGRAGVTPAVSSQDRIKQNFRSHPTGKLNQAHRPQRAALEGRRSSLREDRPGKEACEVHMPSRGSRPRRAGQATESTQPGSDPKTEGEVIPKPEQSPRGRNPPPANQGRARPGQVSQVLWEASRGPAPVSPVNQGNGFGWDQ